MLQEMNEKEILDIEGGIGLIGILGIGAGVLVGGTALGLGITYIVSKF